MNKKPGLLTLGWREWVGLPELGILRIKAKVDTGARTSALHAFEVTPITEGGRERVAFRMHPVQKDNDTVIDCVADIVDKRVVTDSGGHKEERYVIRTELQIGKHHWPIEATLTSRDDMLFRMLIGRTALKKRAVVNPARSYVLGKKPKSVARNGDK
ncbi:MAG: ATP-dependent zinc protease [Gammaproteobacteria bacterium]|nr:ATP-dependent zinc protease [Gammaproteobacteria bacterium]